VKKIMASNPVPIIVFSSLTQQGAQATLDALNAGALDFLLKKFEDIALNRKEAILLLQNRVKALCVRKMFKRGFLSRPTIDVANKNVIKVVNTPDKKNNIHNKISRHYACLAIGISSEDLCLYRKS
jgi:two-component system chemotaxis response regulator CheB